MRSIYIGQLVQPAAAPLIMHMRIHLGGVAIVYYCPHPAQEAVPTPHGDLATWPPFHRSGSLMSIRVWDPARMERNLPCYHRVAKHYFVWIICLMCVILDCHWILTRTLKIKNWFQTSRVTILISFLIWNPWNSSIIVPHLLIVKSHRWIQLFVHRISLVLSTLSYVNHFSFYIL